MRAGRRTSQRTAKVSIQSRSSGNSIRLTIRPYISQQSRVQTIYTATAVRIPCEMHPRQNLKYSLMLFRELQFLFIYLNKYFHVFIVLFNYFLKLFIYYNFYLFYKHLFI